MKLVYTDIRTPLTQVLVDEANRLVAEGKRVFYIAPNSLSFEKEGKVLQLLDQKASFAITITRFAQMARYFTLNESHQQQSLDDIGLGMLFFKVLSQMPDEELKVYARLKKDPQFIQQLIQLFHDSIRLGCLARSGKERRLGPYLESRSRPVSRRFF